MAGTLRFALTDPQCVIALTGGAGLGKTTVVAGVLSELRLTGWTVSALRDDVSSVLALLHHGIVPRKFVLVIDDAHALPLRLLVPLFELLAQDRAALPRLILIGQPSFWPLVRSPEAGGLQDQIDTVAVLFPMTDTESERYVRRGLGLEAPKRSRQLMQAVVQFSQGNPRRLQDATTSWRRSTALAYPRPLIAAAANAGHSRLVPGTLALLVLVLAMWALTLSFVEPPSPLLSAVPSPVKTTQARTP